MPLTTPTIPHYPPLLRSSQALTPETSTFHPLQGLRACFLLCLHHRLLQFAGQVMFLLPSQRSTPYFHLYGLNRPGSAYGLTTSCWSTNGTLSPQRHLLRLLNLVIRVRFTMSRLTIRSKQTQCEYDLGSMHMIAHTRPDPMRQRHVHCCRHASYEN